LGQIFTKTRRLREEESRQSYLDRVTLDRADLDRITGFT
jgi:hypothetical protein